MASAAADPQGAAATAVPTAGSAGVAVPTQTASANVGQVSQQIKATGDDLFVSIREMMDGIFEMIDAYIRGASRPCRSRVNPEGLLECQSTVNQVHQQLLYPIVQPILLYCIVAAFLGVACCCTTSAVLQSRQFQKSVDICLCVLIVLGAITSVSFQGGAGHTVMILSAVGFAATGVLSMHMCFPKVLSKMSATYRFRTVVDRSADPETRRDQRKDEHLLLSKYLFYGVVALPLVVMWTAMAVRLCVSDTNGQMWMPQSRSAGLMRKFAPLNTNAAMLNYTGATGQFTAPPSALHDDLPDEHRYFQARMLTERPRIEAGDWLQMSRDGDDDAWTVNVLGKGTSFRAEAKNWSGSTPLVRVKQSTDGEVGSRILLDGGGERCKEDSSACPELRVTSWDSQHCSGDTDAGFCLQVETKKNLEDAFPDKWETEIGTADDIVSKAGWLDPALFFGDDSATPFKIRHDNFKAWKRHTQQTCEACGTVQMQEAQDVLGNDYATLTAAQSSEANRTLVGSMSGLSRKQTGMPPMPRKQRNAVFAGTTMQCEDKCTAASVRNVVITSTESGGVAQNRLFHDVPPRPFWETFLGWFPDEFRVRVEPLDNLRTGATVYVARQEGGPRRYATDPAGGPWYEIQDSTDAQDGVYEVSEIKRGIATVKPVAAAADALPFALPVQHAVVRPGDSSGLNVSPFEPNLVTKLSPKEEQTLGYGAAVAGTAAAANAVLEGQRTVSVLVVTDRDGVTTRHVFDHSAKMTFPKGPGTVRSSETDFVEVDFESEKPPNLEALRGEEWADLRNRFRDQNGDRCTEGVFPDGATAFDSDGNEVVGDGPTNSFVVSVEGKPTREFGFTTKERLPNLRVPDRVLLVDEGLMRSYGILEAGVSMYSCAGLVAVVSLACAWCTFCTVATVVGRGTVSLNKQIGIGRWLPVPCHDLSRTVWDSVRTLVTDRQPSAGKRTPVLERYLRHKMRHLINQEPGMALTLHNFMVNESTDVGTVDIQTLKTLKTNGKVVFNLFMDLWAARSAAAKLEHNFIQDCQKHTKAVLTITQDGKVLCWLSYSTVYEFDKPKTTWKGAIKTRVTPLHDKQTVEFASLTESKDQEFNVAADSVSPAQKVTLEDVATFRGRADHLKNMSEDPFLESLIKKLKTHQGTVNHNKVAPKTPP